jgi:hypothetical protein
VNHWTATTTNSAATWKTPTLDEMLRSMQEFEEKHPPPPSPLPYACAACKRVSPKDRRDSRYFEPVPIYHATPGMLVSIPLGPPIAYVCRDCRARMLKAFPPFAPP